MKKKEIQRHKLLEYISNPENEPLSRSGMAQKALGYKDSKSLYRIFTPDELAEIEGEALKLRRKVYAGMLAKVDMALLRRAAEGEPLAAKLAYQRFEGWAPPTKQAVEHSGEVASPQINISPAVRALLDRLKADIRK